MLLSLDKSAANKYLNPSPEKLKSKGVDSVRARIMNLDEVNPGITHEKYCEAMKNAFKKKHKGKACEEIILDETEMKKIPEIDSIYKETSSWEWRFGETPEFDHTIEKKFDWGLVELCLKVNSAKIQESKIYSDSLYPDFIDTFNALLSKSDVTYNKQGWSIISDQMESLCSNNKMYLNFIKDINNLVCERIQ